MLDSRIFNTEKVNLQDLENTTFSIPTYQRPYVWGKEELDKLIKNFYDEFLNNEDYYIGTILTKKIEKNDDLIDGQQRFTTLWLIAFIFKKMDIKTNLVSFLEVGNQLKLKFEIRKEVELYLTQLLEKPMAGIEVKIEASEIKTYPYLINIAEAIATIENNLNQLDKNILTEFGNYIYSKVYMIKNEAPENINLNKLFETINSSGIQLEQTDIVKSNLLKIIGDEKVLYSKIWESCQDMDNFFERNVRHSFSQSEWRSIDLSQYVKFDQNIFIYKSEGENNEVSPETIEDILNSSESTIEEDSTNDNGDLRRSSSMYCRSIINFGQLLLHTYRIHMLNEHQKDFEGTFHINRIVEIFSDLESRKNKDEVKRFFLLLWDIRYIFDKYFIKWVSDIDEKIEHLELTNMNRNREAYYSRTNYEKSSLMMLQSVMYFTGDYLRQYWITTFLTFLLSQKDDRLEPTNDIILFELERIDKALSLNTSLKDKEATFLLINSDISKDRDIKSYLESNKGTRFKHYWFQKVEYILWKNWKDRNDEKFKNFRITSKNSIEHIYPQRPKHQVTLESDVLNSFGNLVLLSVSQNSEYSNKEVNVKRAEFREKQTYDSLKSYLIFQYEDEWNISTINAHQEEIIEILIQFYDDCRLVK